MAKKLNVPKFYIVLTVLWIIGLTALFAGLLVLRSYLAEYESVQPKYKAEEIYSTYFKNADFKALLDISGENVSRFETNDTVAAYLTTLVGGKELTYHNISSGLDKDTSKYIVKYNDGDSDIKVASFTLAAGGEKSEKGFARYELSDFELFYPTSKSVTIKVLHGSKVFLNGNLLEDDLVVGNMIPHELNSGLPEGVPGIFYTEYRVDGLCVTPEIDVVDQDGNDAALNSDGGTYLASVVYDEALAAEHSEFVIGAAKTFATYMQNDCTLAKLNPYFEKGTSLYNSIKGTLQWAVIDHDSYTFEDIETSEFYAYDENTFSCRVRLTHVLKRARLEDYRDRMDAIFYLRLVDGKWLVYNRINN